MTTSWEIMRAEADEILALCRKAGLRLATAESCTGGLIAAVLTDIPGSSDVFERGFVTYSNEAKSELLGVPADLIAKHGAVSREVAEAMARGALANSHADIAVAVTGVAGPGGGTSEKPVGLVHLAGARGGRVIHRPIRLGDIGRSQIREASVAEAFRLVRTLAGAGEGVQARAP
jgi:nicotinamide-nucleotide amidase